jgi:hypothetical protein
VFYPEWETNFLQKNEILRDAIRLKKAVPGMGICFSEKE